MRQIAKLAKQDEQAARARRARIHRVRVCMCMSATHCNTLQHTLQHSMLRAAHGLIGVGCEYVACMCICMHVCMYVCVGVCGFVCVVANVCVRAYICTAIMSHVHLDFRLRNSQTMS